MNHGSFKTSRGSYFNYSAICDELFELNVIEFDIYNIGGTPVSYQDDFIKQHILEIHGSI